jgi:UDP-N-acetylmuramoylalanine--D-glutamate ligase
VKHLDGLHVLILGLGASGLAMARWCARHGAAVTVADTREAPPQLAALRDELPGAAFIGGPLTAALIEGAPVRAVYRSPGLSPDSVAAVVDAARAVGLPVGGELDLFAQALADLRAAEAAPEVADDGAPEPVADEDDDSFTPAPVAPPPAQGYAPAVLAITGTNGKTTVTSLTRLLVERAGKSVALAGNIGPTLLDTLSRHMESGTLPEVWVLELSSFQLESAQGFEPTAAAVLNVTQDHFDWHADMAVYAAAKARIFGQRGTMVLNRDDQIVMAMKPAAPVKLAKGQVARNVITFGADMPRRPGDYGIERVHGMTWLVRALEADETRKRKRGAAAEEEDIHIQRLMPADALRIRGRHNALNALAALALATAAGCQLAPMLYGLREYRGEPHRVESIAVIGEVEYFDDSKGTNVGATVAALNGLGEERRVVVILGGEGKGQDFAPLAEPVRRHARAVLLIGRDAPLIASALESTGVSMQTAASMSEAARLAAQRAQPGDAVLLSPACASFDMFRDYEHRAEVFCEAVRELAGERGTA